MKKPVIGICQMKVAAEKQLNISKARSMIREAAARGSTIVVLPEMFNCPYDSSYFKGYAEEYPGGETVKMLAEAARQDSIYLVGGSIPERDGSLVYNTCFIFGPQGDLLAKHQKLHLFDVDLEGGLSFQESKTLGRGRKITLVEAGPCTCGVAICYDLRFPELSRLMALAGAELIIVPAAFNMITGPAHWELLLRSRAVDNQVYVAAAAPARDPDASYVSYGNSAVVDPWGRIVAQAGESENIIWAEIDLAYVNQVRRELPLIKHRRTDLYQLRTPEA